MEGSHFYPQTPISIENEYYFWNPNRFDVKFAEYAGNRCYGTSSFSVPNRKWLEDKGVNQISPSMIRASTLQRRVPSVGPLQQVSLNRIENVPPDTFPGPTCRLQSQGYVNRKLRARGDGALEPPKFKIRTPLSNLDLGWNQHDGRISYAERRGNEVSPRSWQYVTDEGAPRANDRNDLVSENMMFPDMERREVLTTMRNHVPSARDRYWSRDVYDPESDDVFHDHVSPVKSTTFTPCLGYPSFGIQKRRHSSASLPDSKRSRSPTKSSAHPFQPTHSGDSSDYSPTRTLKPRSKPRLANQTRFEEDDVDDYSYEADNSSWDESGAEKFIFPGDTPYRGGIRRQDPVDRRYTTSPRTLIRIFANVKELTNRVREEADFVDDWGRSSASQEVSPSHPNDYRAAPLPHTPVRADTIRQHQLHNFGYMSVPELNRHSHIRSHGCAPSRTKPSQDQRQRSNSGCHSSATKSERGFIGGYKLMRRLQGFSDSDSDKDRRFQRLNLPKSKVDLPSSEARENEGNETIELATAGPSNIENRPRSDDEIREIRSETSESRRMVGSSGFGAEVGCDIGARGDALDEEARTEVGHTL